MSKAKEKLLNAAAEQGEKLINAAGDRVIDRIVSNLLGDKDATRSTDVVIYNHTDHTLHKTYERFESGGFSDKYKVLPVEPYSARAYKVESHGFMSGVTGAEVRFSFNPQNRGGHKLTIVTSNPYAGDNHRRVTSAADLTTNDSMTVGDNNRVDVHVYDA